MNDEPQRRPAVSYSFGPFTGVGATQTPPSEPGREPFVFNGEALDVENLPWRVWANMRAEFGTAPGWSFTRFARRIRNEGEEDRCNQVFGIVSGAFGIYRNNYMICGNGRQFDGQLSVLTHLTSGVVIAVFTEDADAIAAVAAIERGTDWTFTEPLTDASRGAYHAALDRFAAANIGRLVVHAHDMGGDDPGPALEIWAMKVAEVNRGSKLS